MTTRNYIFPFMIKKNQKTPEELKEIEAKACIAMSDFNNLLQPGKIAFYKSCEVTQFFLISREDHKVVNYYALFTFEEKPLENETTKYLLPKPFRINDKFSLGALQKRIPISKARDIFANIQNGVMDIDGPCSIPNKMSLLSKTFIPQGFGEKTILTNVLKNNIWKGNYIIEFFNEAKDFPSDINERSKIDKINRKIREILPIDLSSVHDRIGNIVFQFPVTLMNLDILFKGNGTEVKIVCQQHPLINQERNILIQVSSIYDNCTTGFFSKHFKNLDFEFNAVLGDDFDIHITVIDCDNNILLFDENKINYMKSVGTCFNVMDSSEPRTIPQKDGTVKTVQLSNPMLSNTGIVYSDTHYRSQIGERIRNNKILSHNGDYIALKANQSEKGLSFLRAKLKDPDIKEICLWDPYLKAQDIMDVLYYEPTGKPFRCIASATKAFWENEHSKACSSKVQGSSESTFEKYRSECRSHFKRSNNKNVQLKILAQHDNFGWKFHDRFLILVPQNPRQLPDAYSLGTSINSIGKSHHIIQKVTNAREILDNFEELWEKLDNKDCCVIELPQMQEEQ